MIELRDLGIPTSLLATDRAYMTVNVIRNNQPPLFFGDVYNVTISERESVGYLVVRVFANDSDPSVSAWFLLADPFILLSMFRWRKLFIMT